MTAFAWALILAVAVVGLLLVRMLQVAARAAEATHDVHRLQHTLAAVAETTHEWLWSTDRHGRIAFSSPTSHSLLGYLPNELLGTDAYLLIDPGTRQVWRDRVSELGRRGLGWADITVQMRHRDGTLVDVESSAAPILDGQGVAIGFQGTARPVTSDLARLAHEARIRGRIERVLAGDSLRIAFQPIVSLSTGAMVGVEALARIGNDRHQVPYQGGRNNLGQPAEPYEPPNVWIKHATDVGLGVKLELKALRGALDAISLLPAGLYVSINASPRTIADPAFLELLLTHGTPLNRLVLEITEHESIPDYAPLTHTLTYARSLGLRLAIDDAGAGYASFRHILTLRPDYIKLDRCLTAGIDADPARRALASAVVMFALELDAVVTAEGVETASELDTLRSLAVDAAQGYYLARPSTDRTEWASWPGRRLHLTTHEPQAVSGFA